MSVRLGGVWRFVMHGPDGRDYKNKLTFVEVVEPERLVYSFAEEAGKTRLTMRMVFPSAAARDHVPKYGAMEGLTQTMNRLEQFLARP